jgi:hypothetical protein
MYSISFVLLLEITVPKDRLFATNILAYAFSIGQIILVGLAYYFKNWLKIQWALAVYLIPFLWYYWMVPESPRWLLSMNRVQHARLVIEKIARVNRAYENWLERMSACIFRGKKKIDHKSRVDPENLESWTYVFTLLQEEANKLSELKRQNSFRNSFIGITRSPILLRRCFFVSFCVSLFMCFILCFIIIKVFHSFLHLDGHTGRVPGHRNGH